MNKIKTFHRKTLQSKGRLLDLSSPKIMGILNINDDSFYEGSRYNTEEKAVSVAETMIGEGAEILDLGAMSSRPGASISDPDEELKNLLPVLKAVRKISMDCFVSVDTVHAKVADAAIQEGADIINDISGAKFDEALLQVIAKQQVPYVLMHMKGTPANMVQQTDYNDLLAEMLNYFNAKIARLKEIGIQDIVVDPGFGFAKNIDQNFYLLKALKTFKHLHFPVLAGISRKSMIWKSLNIEANEALNGTTALHMLALQNGADLLRVHDVKAAQECITLFKKYKNSSAV